MGFGAVRAMKPCLGILCPALIHGRLRDRVEDQSKAALFIIRSTDGIQCFLRGIRGISAWLGM